MATALAPVTPTPSSEPSVPSTTTSSTPPSSKKSSLGDDSDDENCKDIREGRPIDNGGIDGGSGDGIVMTEQGAAVTSTVIVTDDEDSNNVQPVVDRRQQLLQQKRQPQQQQAAASSGGSGNNLANLNVINDDLFKDTITSPTRGFPKISLSLKTLKKTSKFLTKRMSLSNHLGGGSSHGNAASQWTSLNRQESDSVSVSSTRDIWESIRKLQQDGAGTDGTIDEEEDSYSTSSASSTSLAQEEKGEELDEDLAIVKEEAGEEEGGDEEEGEDQPPCASPLSKRSSVVSAASFAQDDSQASGMNHHGGDGNENNGATRADVSGEDDDGEDDDDMSEIVEEETLEVSHETFNGQDVIQLTIISPSPPKKASISRMVSKRKDDDKKNSSDSSPPPSPSSSLTSGDYGSGKKLDDNQSNEEKGTAATPSSTTKTSAALRDQLFVLKQELQAIGASIRIVKRGAEGDEDVELDMIDGTADGDANGEDGGLKQKSRTSSSSSGSRRRKSHDERRKKTSSSCSSSSRSRRSGGTSTSTSRSGRRRDHHSGKHSPSTPKKLSVSTSGDKLSRSSYHEKKLDSNADASTTDDLLSSPISRRSSHGRRAAVKTSMATSISPRSSHRSSSTGELPDPSTSSPSSSAKSKSFQSLSRGSNHRSSSVGELPSGSLRGSSQHSKSTGLGRRSSHDKKVRERNSVRSSTSGVSPRRTSTGENAGEDEALADSYVPSTPRTRQHPRLSSLSPLSPKGVSITTPTTNTRRSVAKDALLRDSPGTSRASPRSSSTKTKPQQRRSLSPKVLRTSVQPRTSVVAAANINSAAGPISPRATRQRVSVRKGITSPAATNANVARLMTGLALTPTNDNDGDGKDRKLPSNTAALPFLDDESTNNDDLDGSMMNVFDDEYHTSVMALLK